MLPAVRAVQAGVAERLQLDGAYVHILNQLILRTRISKRASATLRGSTAELQAEKRLEPCLSLSGFSPACPAPTPSVSDFICRAAALLYSTVQRVQAATSLRRADRATAERAETSADSDPFRPRVSCSPPGLEPSQSCSRRIRPSLILRLRLGPQRRLGRAASPRSASGSSTACNQQPYPRLTRASPLAPTPAWDFRFARGACVDDVSTRPRDMTQCNRSSRAELCPPSTRSRTASGCVHPRP